MPPAIRKAGREIPKKARRLRPVKKKKIRKPMTNRATKTAMSRAVLFFTPRVAAANRGTLPTGSIRAKRAMKKLTAKISGTIGVPYPNLARSPTLETAG